ncbi:hypothetical protein [Kribbella yunnanensis]
MRNPAFGSAVAFAAITMLGGCGPADEPAAVKPSSRRRPRRRMMSR